MFLTYLRRELVNRRRQTLVVSMGLALGVALVLTVSAVSNGVQKSQSQVLQSLYGVGTDISVTKVVTPDAGGDGQNNGRRFNIGGGAGQVDANGNRVFARSRLILMPGTETFDVASVTAAKNISGVDGVTTSLKLTSLTFNGQLPDFANNGQSSSSSTPGMSLPPIAAPSGTDVVTPNSIPSGGRKGNGGGGFGSNFSIDTFSVMGVDLSVSGVGPLSSTTLTSGRVFTQADSGTQVAVLDSTYATSKTLAIDGTVSIGGKDFKIIGILASSTSEAETASNVYIPLDQAQSLSTNPDVVSNIYVKAKSSSGINQIATDLKAALPDATVSTTADLASTISGSLSTASNLIDNLGRWLSIIALTIAFLIAILFTTSGVTRRTREFGTLKALGWKSRHIVRQVAAESVVHGVLGGLIGVCLGFASVKVFNAFAPTVQASTSPFAAAGGGFAGRGGGGPFGGGGGRFASALGSTVNIALKASATPGIIASAIALALLGGIMAGVFGGLRAARLRPAEALRSVA